MAKYFLDCGAWNGYSVKVFRQVYDPDYEYTIHSFEADPDHARNFPEFDKHVFHEKAVWIEDGTIDFYVDSSRKRASGTLVKEKTTGILDKKNPHKAQGIDFDRWIKENLKKTDRIVLKLDIEGAEYKVLPHMIKNGSIDYVDQIFIEWHWNKVGEPKAKHDEIVKQILGRCIPIVERWKVGYKK